MDGNEIGLRIAGNFLSRWERSGRKRVDDEEPTGRWVITDYRRFGGFSSSGKFSVDEDCGDQGCRRSRPGRTSRRMRVKAGSLRTVTREGLARGSAGRPGTSTPSTWISIINRSDDFGKVALEHARTKRNGRRSHLQSDSTDIPEFVNVRNPELFVLHVGYAGLRLIALDHDWRPSAVVGEPS